MKGINLILFALCLLFNKTTIGQNWQRTNPGGGGYMMSVGAGPTGTILVGSDLSGAYRSIDEGESWDVIGHASGLSASHVSTVGFDPINENILYLGTNIGIFRSNDGGDSMIHVFNPGGPAKAIGDIQISLNNPNIGYATYQPTWNGLQGVVYKTTDHGLTWAQISLDLPNNLRLLKLIIDPADSDIVYALSGFDRFACGPAELYKSTNGGLNWTELASTIADTIQIMDVAVDPINPQTVYMTTMNVPCNSGVAYEGDIFKSNDGGNTWFDPNPNIERSGVIWIKQNDPSIIRLIDVRKTAPWIPTSGTFTSLDSGVTWTQTGFETNWDPGYSADVSSNTGTVIHKSYGSNKNFCRTLGTDMSDPDKIYWVNTRFVYGTDDGGTIFNNLFTKQAPLGSWQSTGVDNIIIHDIEINEADPNIVYAGLADNGLWRSLDAGASWSSCNEPSFTGTWQGFGGNTYCIAPDPTRANVVWSTMAQGNICHLVRSDSTGKIGSWVLSNSGLPPTSRVTDLAVDPNSNAANRTLFAIVSGDIYKSTDDGYSWTLSANNGGVWFVEIDPNDSNIIYAGGSGGFFRSIDSGSSWTQTGLPEMSEVTNTQDFWRKSYRGVSNIHPSYCDAGTVFATAYGPQKGLYKSIDYGATWSKIIADDYMRSVVVSENNHQVIFVGSSYLGYAGGVSSPNQVAFQYSLDGGLTWAIDDAELEYPSIVSMELNHSNPEKLFVASQGTGMQWTYDWIVPYRYYADTDNDSFGDPNNSIDTCISVPPAGYTLDDQDCDDGNSNINPNAIEIPDNGIDEDCSGADSLVGLGFSNSDVNVTLKLFPNPVKNEVTLTCECNGLVQIELTNILGQSVLKKEYLVTNNNNLNLNVESLPAGSYWMQIYIEKDEFFTTIGIVKIE
ncbi:MAG: T9SS type A sorting domain-containing protein [Crocinitomicaceae bacterium]